MRSCLHTTRFLGDPVPCSGIGDAYTAQHDYQKRHLLINDYTLGASLAAAADNTSGQYRYHKTVLQCGHGFIALGESIEEATYNAIYTVKNARVQIQAEQRRNSDSGPPLQFLSPVEIAACAPMDRDCIVKVWPLWMQ